jgi:hypothetical protein
MQSLPGVFLLFYLWNADLIKVFLEKFSASLYRTYADVGLVKEDERTEGMK